MLISNHVSPANILQISDVIHGIVFLLFVLHFTAVVRLFLLCEKWEIFSHFLLPYQNKATSPPGFLGRLLCTIDDIFQISQTSSNLVSVNWLQGISRGIWVNQKGEMFKMNNINCYCYREEKLFRNPNRTTCMTAQSQIKQYFYELRKVWCDPFA